MERSWSSYLSYVARALLVLALDLTSFTFMHRVYFSLSHGENHVELLFIFLMKTKTFGGETKTRVRNC